MARLGCLLTDFALSSRRSTSMKQLLPRSNLYPNRSCQSLVEYRSPERCPDHLLRAARPAAVFARLVHGDRQIVPALVMSSRSARGAARHPIPAGLSCDFDVIQNPKLPRLRCEILRDLRPARTLRKFGRDLFSVDDALQMILRNLGESVQVCELVSKGVVGSIEPIPPSPALARAPVDTERGADGVPEFVGAQFVLLGKDLDTLRKS